MQDAGDVGCEEEFAFAEAEDDGRAKTRGDEFIGLVGRENADGKGPGEALDGAADGFFQRNGGLAAGEGEDGFGGVGFGGV
jgi:hypothetical protein